MLFSYKVKTKNGEIVNGSMDAIDRFALSRELKSRELIVVSVSEKGKDFSIDSLLSSFSGFFSKVKTQELVIMTKNLSGMLKAGLPLSRALSVLQKQTKKVFLCATAVASADRAKSTARSAPAGSSRPWVSASTLSLK